MEIILRSVIFFFFYETNRFLPNSHCLFFHGRTVSFSLPIFVVDTRYEKARNKSSSPKSASLRENTLCGMENNYEDVTNEAFVRMRR